MTNEAQDGRRTARQLLAFLEEMMRTIARVDLGQSGVAQLSLLEMRLLIALGELGAAASLAEIAHLTETSVGQSGQASERLRSRGLAARAGGGRAWLKIFRAGEILSLILYLLK